MSDTIAAFSTFYEPYHNITPQRARERLALLTMLEASIPGSITTVTPDDVNQYLAAQTWAPQTTLKAIKMLRPFFHWLWSNGHITAEQFMRLKEVKAPRGAGGGKPRPYSRHQIAAFWEYFDAAYPWSGEKERIDRQTTARGEFWAQRYSLGLSGWHRVQPYARRLQAEAVVSLLLFGGLRKVEAFNLTLENMHYDNAFVRAMGACKNTERESYERAIPMVEQMRVALANWMEFRAQVVQPDHDRPWLSLVRDNFREPMKFGAFGALLGRVGPEGHEMHRMRHTFATEQLRAGMPVETLKEIMGHTNISQTLRYANISTDDVVRVAAKTNNRFGAAVERSHEIMR
jgi:site-specific recombinase XerD